MSDDQFEQWLKAGNLREIEAAAKQDPGLIARGWRGGVFPWIKMAMLYETYPKTVPVLLACGADINAANRDQPDEDALNAALAASDIDRVRFLLQHGAKPTKPHVVWGAVTASDHQLELVRMLEAHGADIHEVDEGGFSGRYANPLSLAKDYGLDEVVAYLESRGCVMPPPDEDDSVAPSTTRSQQIIEHFTKTVGSPEKLAIIQIVPTGIPIAIHAIPADEQHPFVTLFTTGMSEYPMNAPEGAEEYALAELYIQLPADWKYREYENPIWGWPQHWLRSMAQYPQQHNTWLGGPVALVANGEPPEPLAPNTRFTTLMLLADQSATSADGKKIWLYRLTPLFTEERQLEIDQGLAALLNALDANDAPMIVDMNRKSVVVNQ